MVMSASALDTSATYQFTVSESVRRRGDRLGLDAGLEARGGQVAVDLDVRLPPVASTLTVWEPAASFSAVRNGPLVKLDDVGTAAGLPALTSSPMLTVLAVVAAVRLPNWSSATTSKNTWSVTSASGSATESCLSANFTSSDFRLRASSETTVVASELLLAPDFAVTRMSTLPSSSKPVSRAIAT